MKKVIATILLIVMMIGFLGNCKVQANDSYVVKRELDSVSAKIEPKLGDYDTSTGLSTAAGVIVEPLIEFITVIVDSAFGLLTKCMTGNEFEPVMVGEPQDSGENVGATITIDNLDDYKNLIDQIDVKYPNIHYSPEDIFAGKIDFLNINFFRTVTDESTTWAKIRNVIASWYKILRLIAIVALLSILIYIGIKIIVSSSSKDKAKYKERLISWFIAVALLFSLQYIMAFIVNAVEQISQLLSGLMGNLRVNMNGTTFTTNLIGLARFKMQQNQFSTKIGYFMLYVGLVVLTFKFTFVYLKRLLMMSFLTLISPIVAATYPIDKAESGKAKGFDMWLKEYTYNMLLQPMHYILYVILISSSLTLAANNLVYAFVAFMFMNEGEKILKKIFGFGKAGGGTVGGIGAFTTGALASNVTKMFRDPLHRGGKMPNLVGGSNSESEDTGNPKPTKNDIDIESIMADSAFNLNLNSNLNVNQNSNPNIDPNDFSTQIVLGAGVEDSSSLGSRHLNLLNAMGSKEQEKDNSDVSDLTEEETPEDEEQQDDNFEEKLNYENNVPEDSEKVLNIQNSNDIYGNLIAKYRSGLSQDELNLIFNDGDPHSLDEIYELIATNENKQKNSKNAKEIERLQKEILKYKSLARNRIMASEFNFTTNELPLQYIDGDRRTSQELMNNIIDYKKLLENPNLSENDRNKYLNMVKTDSAILNRRLAENNFMRDNHVIDTILIGQVSNGVVNNNISNGAKTKVVLGKNQKNKTDPKKKVANNASIRNIANNKEEIRTNNQNTKKVEEKKKNIVKPLANGVINVGKTLIRPVVDVDQDAKTNIKRFVRNSAGVIAGTTLGVVTAATQGAISMADGKYNAFEALGSFSAGYAGGKKLMDMATAPKSEEKLTMEQYQESWYNRRDVIDKYNYEYSNKAKEYRKRARENYVSRGVVDFSEQKQAMKFANEILKEGKVANLEEADRLAVATLRYKQKLLSDSNYPILYDENRRQKYMKSVVKSYRGSASENTVRATHNNFIENVKRFDEINNN